MSCKTEVATFIDGDCGDYLFGDMIYNICICSWIYDYIGTLVVG